MFTIYDSPQNVKQTLKIVFSHIQKKAFHGNIDHLFQVFLHMLKKKGSGKWEMYREVGNVWSQKKNGHGLVYSTLEVIVEGRIICPPEICWISPAGVLHQF